MLWAERVRHIPTSDLPPVLWRRWETPPFQRGIYHDEGCAGTIPAA
jgi:hypothetical protein